MVVHLDHGLKEETCRQALDLGFSSIMYDCSTMEYEANIEHVKRMAETAHACGASIEAELGHVGDNGGEDPSLFYTDSAQARDLLRGPEQMRWPLPWVRLMAPTSFRLSWILTGLLRLRKTFQRPWSFTGAPVCRILISGQRWSGESARSIFSRISTRPVPGRRPLATGKEWAYGYHPARDRGGETVCDGEDETVWVCGPGE